LVGKVNQDRRGLFARSLGFGALCLDFREEFADSLDRFERWRRGKKLGEQTERGGFN